MFDHVCQSCLPTRFSTSEMLRGMRGEINGLHSLTCTLSLLKMSLSSQRTVLKSVQAEGELSKKVWETVLVVCCLYCCEKCLRLSKEHIVL